MAVAETHLPNAFFLVPHSVPNAVASAFLSALQDFAALTLSSSWASSSASASAFLAFAFSETHLPKAFFEPGVLTARHSSTACERASLACVASSAASSFAVCETHLP